MSTEPTCHNRSPIFRSWRPALLIILAAPCLMAAACTSQYFDAPRLGPGECKVDARLLCQNAAYPGWLIYPVRSGNGWESSTATLWTRVYYEVPSGDVIDLHCAISAQQDRLINAVAQPEVLPASADADWLRTHDLCKAFGL
jgi:hypothetical protein